MFSEPSKPSENTSKVWENFQLHLGFSLIWFRILPNVYGGFHQAMKALRKYFISYTQTIFILNFDDQRNKAKEKRIMGNANQSFNNVK